ncbi:molybdopterin synthase sulfur carrier subunit [Marmoricola sp. OAE513]|uniref:MoaD/ThiS family protein n=1 Tax=Marmoricola sp. OAE513 TaxID=2817894 RepID=UPI001AE547C6
METTSGPVPPGVGQITLRYWASAKALAGVGEEQVAVTGPVTLAWLIEDAVSRLGAGSRLEKVLDTCSVLLGDEPVGTRDRASVEVSPGQAVEFLPPFAGG